MFGIEQKKNERIEAYEDKKCERIVGDVKKHDDMQIEMKITKDSTTKY